MVYLISGRNLSINNVQVPLRLLCQSCCDLQHVMNIFLALLCIINHNIFYMTCCLLNVTGLHPVPLCTKHTHIIM